MIAIYIANKAFYFERFYMSFIFSIIALFIWFLLKNWIKKPIRKDVYKNSREFYSWYFQYKLYLILIFLLIIGVGALIISLVSLIQYLL